MLDLDGYKDFLIEQLKEERKTGKYEKNLALSR